MKRYALVAVLALASARPALAACSNHTLNGTYGLDGSGTIFQPPGFPPIPVAGPFVRVGAVRFDGAGGVRYTTVSSYNGIVGNEPYEGAYTVGEDCSFEYRAVLPLTEQIQLPVTFRGFVSANGDRLDYMLADPPGAAVHATLTRQPKENCQTRDLFGTYTLTSHGVVLAPNSAAGEFVRVGTLNAFRDPGVPGAPPPSAGLFTLTATTNHEGVNWPETIGGSYEVQPNCTVRFDYAPTTIGGDSSFSGVLVSGDRQVIFMISTDLFVVSGTMTRR